MKRRILGFEDPEATQSALVGGKFFALTKLSRAGFAVPRSICATSELYDAFVDETGLRVKIGMELARKNLEEMRWEELWDASIRIRNLFLKTPLPRHMEAEIESAVGSCIGDVAIAVRSSALGEDSARTSFAGAHESFLDVRGTGAVIESLRLVWASLFSDRALLYRKEMRLEVAKSRMAAVIQELVRGKFSGVAFSRSPADRRKMVVEAVRGLGEKLVDGSAEPDRWIIDRKGPGVLPRLRAKRKPNSPALSVQQVADVARLVLSAEKLFGRPQDMEWTIRGPAAVVLQSRPITTEGKKPEADRRSFDAGLRRSFDELVALKSLIERKIIPGMRREARLLGRLDLQGMPDKNLSAEILRRERALKKWTDEYWESCIPFGHGVRLFGSFYNDAVGPADPHEFIALLEDSSPLSVMRNRALQRLAGLLRKSGSLRKMIEAGIVPGGTFGRELAKTIRSYGAILGGDSPESRAKVLSLLIRMAEAPRKGLGKRKPNAAKMERSFISALPKKKRNFAKRLLSLAKASYRLRDDDNVALSGIELELKRAAEEGLHRLAAVGRSSRKDLSPGEIARALLNRRYRPKPERRRKKAKADSRGVLARQLLGQPAGRGVATGRARIVRSREDAFDFKRGEVMVCDAIGPEITFAVPLASAIVERRGGMLIHGAIVAREYGIPCVTGIPKAAERISDGDTVTVDGTLGIVTIEKKRSPRP
ncbi:MAG TPA: PEP/pyruvate-binding domain-containing protein [bacterium]|nr:PEP/pyruvate-binding domain-containing protein [bacterium]